MASGKTTLGQALGKHLNVEFIDLDLYIERRYRVTIKELFDQHGEAGFRKIEQSVLHEIGEFEDVIISCGGGTPCFFDNMDYMNRQGTTVWLNASVQCLTERLLHNRSRRPLLANKTPQELEDSIVAGLAARQQYYSQAKYELSSDNLESDTDISTTINAFCSIVLKT